MRWLEETAFAEADILVGQETPQPRADAPIINAFSGAQSNRWVTPANGVLSLRLDGRTAVGIVQTGLTGLTAIWRDAGNTQLSANVIASPKTAMIIEFGGSGTADSVDLQVQGAASVFRVVGGTMREIDAVIAPGSIPPKAGLNPDFTNETITSSRNVFLGRTGTRSGETASLTLRHLRRTDPAFDLRARIIEGDALIAMPTTGVFGGDQFYVWADGLVPMPELLPSNRWQMVLPLRYWVDG